MPASYDYAEHKHRKRESAGEEWKEEGWERRFFIVYSLLCLFECNNTEKT